MRTREEVLNSFPVNYPDFQNKLIIEVLLDIRDLLHNRETVTVGDISVSGPNATDLLERLNNIKE